MCAIPGSDTFWCNLHGDGEGDTRTLHAGLLVVNGSKIWAQHLDSAHSTIIRCEVRYVRAVSRSGGRTMSSAML